MRTLTDYGGVQICIDDVVGVIWPTHNPPVHYGHAHALLVFASGAKVRIPSQSALLILLAMEPDPVKQEALKQRSFPGYDRQTQALRAQLEPVE